MSRNGKKTKVKLVNLIDSMLNRIELSSLPTPGRLLILSPVVSLIIALIVSGIVLVLAGSNISAAVSTFAYNAFGSWLGITESLVVFVPLALSALGISIGRKVGFWNIGGEGQFLVGALGGFLVALILPNSGVLGVVGSFLSSFVLAGALCMFIAVLKVTREVDEVLMTLLSNFSILYFIGFLVNGPLQDPLTHWIQSEPLPIEFRFSKIGGFARLNNSFFVLVVFYVIALYLERRTYWDTVFTVVGDSYLAASLQGINYKYIVPLAAFLSGGLCGLAGWFELAGNQYRLIENLSPGYGYYALLISVLSNGRILQTLIFSLLFSVLLNGIEMATRGTNVPIFISEIILGGTLIANMLYVKLSNNKLSIRGRRIKE